MAVARWIGAEEARMRGCLDSLVDARGNERGQVWRSGIEHDEPGTVGWTVYGPAIPRGGYAPGMDDARRIVEAEARRVCGGRLEVTSC